MPRMGLFGPKDRLNSKLRVQGLLTREGLRRFEQARLRLANLSGRDLEDVSDGDTIEYLARGDADPLVRSLRPRQQGGVDKRRRT